MAYKNVLDTLTPLSVSKFLSLKMNPILSTVTENPLRFEQLLNQLTRDYNDVFRFLKNFENTVEEIKNTIQETIDQNNASYFEKSLKNYNESISSETTEYILNRKLSIYDEIVSQLENRIHYYNNWKYVGLILRPGNEDWIQGLVGCDPLYLVDTHDNLLKPALSRFNEQYQRRLRTYTIQETTDSNRFDQLPNGQFGFCLIYNFFNYKPMEIIESYLKELYIKLKPGGIIAFTFNNCDRAEGIELFERNFMSYTPGDNVINLCQSIGYEIKDFFRLDHSCTWVEICKPGMQESLRGGQSLAKTLYKDEYYHYTKEQIENIKQQASDLNIARADELNNMPLGHIIALIKQRTN